MLCQIRFKCKTAICCAHCIRMGKTCGYVCGCTVPGWEGPVIMFGMFVGAQCQLLILGPVVLSLLLSNYAFFVSDSVLEIDQLYVWQ